MKTMCSEMRMCEFSEKTDVITGLAFAAYLKKQSNQRLEVGTTEDFIISVLDLNSCASSSLGKYYVYMY